MVTTISGTIEDGMLKFDKKLPSNKKGRVVLMFIDELIEKKSYKGIRLGGLEGKAILPEDFNEPLEDLKEYMF